MNKPLDSKPRRGIGRNALAARDAELFTKEAAIIAESANAEYEQQESLEHSLLFLSQIALDPENCRRLHIDPEQPLRSLDAAKVDKSLPYADKLIDEIQAVHDLAGSLKEDDLIQPISVYEVEPRSQRYCIAVGHRRYFATLLNGEKQILCRIIHKPGRLRRMQYVENAKQKALDSFEMVRSIRSVVDEEETLVGPVTSGAALGRLLNVSREMGNTYKRLVKPDFDISDVDQAMEEGVLNISQAASIAQFSDPNKRAQLIAEAKLGSLPSKPKANIKPKRLAGGGRKAKTFFKMTTTNKDVAEAILRAIKKIAGRLDKDLQQDYRTADFDDMHQVNKLLSKLIKQIETQQ